MQMYEPTCMEMSRLREKTRKSGEKMTIQNISNMTEKILTPNMSSMKRNLFSWGSQSKRFMELERADILVLFC